MYSRDYAVVNADLRDLKAFTRKLREVGIVFDAPTMFLSECVLVYLEPEDSGAVISWAGTNFPRAAMLTYEQIKPHDAFGQVMVKNLEVRLYGVLYAFGGLTSFMCGNNTVRVLLV